MRIRKLYFAIVVPLVLAAVVAGLGRWREARRHSELTTWLRQNAIVLRTVDPAAELSDLAPLGVSIGDAYIVGAGEGTHGTREHFLFKHRLLRYLVTRNGFRALAFESPWPTGLALNEYVLGGVGDPKRLLGQAVFGVWQTEEVLDTIRWMREYNATVPPDARVEFVGIDMQLTRRAAVEVRTYLSHVDEEYSSVHSGTLNLLAAREMESMFLEVVDDKPRLKQTSDNRRVVAEVRDILARFDARREEYIARSGPREFDLARQHARILVQLADVWEDASEGDRDRYMAENLEWYRARRPGVKVMVWAHNGHVGFAPQTQGSLGQHLKQRHGSGYLSVGFILGSGAYRALDRRKLVPGGTAPWADFKFGDPPPRSFDAAMAATEHALFAVDLRGAAGEARDVVEARYATREGYGNVSEWNVRGSDFLISRKRSLPQSHDLLIYVDKTTPAQPISGGSAQPLPAER